MRWLALISPAGKRWTLPVADASAAALAEALLTDEVAQRARQRTEAAQHDPALAFWASCAAISAGKLPRTLFELSAAIADRLAALLAPRGASVTTVPELPDDAIAAPRSPAEEAFWADRVADHLATAELAARLAGGNAQTSPDEARYLGLLHLGADDFAGGAAEAVDLCGRIAAAAPAAAALAERAARWLRRAEGDASSPPDPQPRPAPTDVCDAATEATGPEEAVLEACRHIAFEGRRRWLQSQTGLADWLLPLARRLARLERLESRFVEAVEAAKLDAMAEFAAGAGHEINNPLTAIPGRAHLLLQD